MHVACLLPDKRLIGFHMTGKLVGSCQAEGEPNPVIQEPRGLLGNI